MLFRHLLQLRSWRTMILVVSSNSIRQLKCSWRYAPLVVAISLHFYLLKGILYFYVRCCVYCVYQFIYSASFSSLLIYISPFSSGRIVDCIRIQFKNSICIADKIRINICSYLNPVWFLLQLNCFLVQEYCTTLTPHITCNSCNTFPFGSFAKITSL